MKTYRPNPRIKRMPKPYSGYGLEFTTPGGHRGSLKDVTKYPLGIYEGTLIDLQHRPTREEGKREFYEDYADRIRQAADEINAGERFPALFVDLRLSGESHDTADLAEARQRAIEAAKSIQRDNDGDGIPTGRYRIDGEGNYERIGDVEPMEQWRGVGLPAGEIVRDNMAPTGTITWGKRPDLLVTYSATELDEAAKYTPYSKYGHYAQDAGQERLEEGQIYRLVLTPSEVLVTDDHFCGSSDQSTQALDDGFDAIECSAGGFYQHTVTAKPEAINVADGYRVEWDAESPQQDEYGVSVGKGRLTPLPIPATKPIVERQPISEDTRVQLEIAPEGDKKRAGTGTRRASAPKGQSKPRSRPRQGTLPGMPAEVRRFAKSARRR